LSVRGDRLKVSVIVPTYNRCDLLHETLRQLTRQRSQPGEFEVIVSDDGSSDETKAVVESFADKLLLKYHFQEDLGFRAGTARNAGARLATAPVLVFLDSGAMASPDYLRHHLAAHGDDADHRAVCGYMYGFNPFASVPGLGAALSRFHPEEVLAQYDDNAAFLDVRHGDLIKCGFELTRLSVPWMLFFTANCSVRAADFWDTGGFDEEFTGWGAEDLEFAFRFFRRGFSFHFTQAAWTIEAPVERDMDTRMKEFSSNMRKFLGKYPEPVVEIGWALVRKNRMFDWEDDYRNLQAWSLEVRDLNVADEVDEAMQRIPRDDRIAVLGAGRNVPAARPATILVDFDKELLDQGQGAGPHLRHHAVGLRTPLADQSVDTVIITSRLAGLRDRWNDDLMTEAHRIGRKVYTP